MSEERLLKAIHTKLEEYGMPVFRDGFPAMDILQLVKDAGYSKQSRQLVELDEKELRHFFHANAMEHEYFGYHNAEELDKLANLTAKKFGQRVVSVQYIEDVISHSNLWKYQVTRTGLQRDKRHLAQAIHKFITESK